MEASRCWECNAVINSGIACNECKRIAELTIALELCKEANERLKVERDELTVVAETLGAAIESYEVGDIDREELIEIGGSSPVMCTAEHDAKVIDDMRLELCTWRHSLTANKGFESAIRIVSKRGDTLRKQARELGHDT
jgi:hypothetical protein